MDVEAAFPSDGEPAEPVEQGEGLLDDVAQLAQALHLGGPGLSGTFAPLVSAWIGVPLPSRIG